MNGNPDASPPRTQGVGNIKQLQQASRLGCFLLILLTLGVFGLATIGPYVDYLWFVHDARQPEVFRTAYSTRGWLFLGAFGVSWVALHFSLKRALNIGLVFLSAPENLGQVMISNALAFLQTRGLLLVRLGVPVFAFLGALGFSNEWNTFLLAQHAQHFGKLDPTFGIDLGFFVFTLPWYRALANYGVSVLLLATCLTVAVYVGLQALASLAKIELGRPRVRTHITVLVALTFFALAAQTWLKTYEVGLTDNVQFTGAGYSAMQALGAQRILAILFGLGGGLALLNIKLFKAYAGVALAAVGIGVWYVLALGIWPTMVERFKVAPNRLDVEAPYAKQAIAMTRFGYDLDRIEVRDVIPTPKPTAVEITAGRPTLDNMRLWDPHVLQDALEGLQGIRPYYTFRDVDIDRYMINGKPTMLMLAARDLNIAGLDPSARNWTNERLVYTHGYGVTVSRVDQATPDGKPVFLGRDIPQVNDDTLPAFEPRIYFGDTRSPDGSFTDEYVLVHTGEPEFDYPSGKSETTQWKGDRGIPISGELTKLAFSILKGDGNLLVSPKLTAGAKLLMHRDIMERASRIYPFLTFDHDPYVVLQKGKTIWVLDGYTTTEMVPYSGHLEDSRGQINYIRNSVKLTIDAYSGEAIAYVVDPTEPILRAYRKIYPGLVRDASEIPAGLAEHFRYPEDLFTIQSAQLTTYHVTDPQVFLGFGDAWDLARQRGLSGEKEAIKPFYVEMKLPDEPGVGFLQIIPFTPKKKINMIGWLASHCDPGTYGKLVLYRFDQSTPIAGPEQLEGTFTATPDISNINRQFNNDQSKVIVGNLLVVPIGKSVMYAESLFLQNRTTGLQAVPRLTKVILSFNGDPVVADTYPLALNKLLGDTGPDLTPSSPTVSAPASTQDPRLEGIRESVGLLDQADAALRKGDFAGFGKLQQQARDRLKALAK